MAKKREKGDSAASNESGGAEGGAYEPEFGSAEWLLAQLNGGRVPAESPRSPLLPPQQPADDGAGRTEPSSDAVEAADAAVGASVDAVPDASVDTTVDTAAHRFVAPAAPVQADAAPAAPEFSTPATPPVAERTAFDELFAPPAAATPTESAPVAPAPAESAPVVPNPFQPARFDAPSVNDVFTPPRSVQPDFFELAIAEPIAVPFSEQQVDGADRGADAAQNENENGPQNEAETQNETEAVVAPELASAAAPETAAVGAEPTSPEAGRSDDAEPPTAVMPLIPPLIAPLADAGSGSESAAEAVPFAEAVPAPAPLSAPMADQSFTSAFLTPIDELDQLFGGSEEFDEDDEAERPASGAPAFNWGLVPGGASAAAAAELVTPEPAPEPAAAAAEPVKAEAAAAAPIPPVAESASDAANEAGPVAEFAGRLDAEQPVEPEAVLDSEAVLEAEPEATPGPELLTAPIAAAASAEAEGTLAEPEATSDDALADWFAANLVSQSADADADAVSDPVVENAQAAEIAVAASEPVEPATEPAAEPAAEPETATRILPAQHDAGAFSGPPTLIAPPAQNEAPLRVPGVAPAAASVPGPLTPPRVQNPPAYTAAAAFTPVFATQAGGAQGSAGQGSAGQGSASQGAAASPFGTLGSAASGGTPPGAPGAGRSGASGGRPPRRALVITLVAVLAVAVLVGLFFVGTQLPRLFGTAATPTPVASAEPSAEPTAEAPPAPVAPTAMQPPGEHAWDALFGGECIDPFTTPWAESFTVVDCAAPHAAQLVFRGSFGGDASTPFPGEEALAGQINALCSAPGIIDLVAASAFSDLQVQGTYPVTEAQWAAGQQSYYCFVNQAAGEPIVGSIAGPGPTA